MAAAPDLALAFAERANALMAQQRDDEAMRLVDAAIAIDPALNGAKFLKGLLSLARGDFATGWPLFEYREFQLNAQGAGMARYPAARQWDGRRFAGRLLLWAEQGFGDSIQMLRYVPLVRRLAPDIVLEVQSDLVRLAATLGVDTVPAMSMPLGTPSGRYDAHCSLMSLPYLFRNTPVAIPAAPYLRVPRDPRRRPLGLGIFWRSRSTETPTRRARNIPYRHLEPLADEFDFVSLQPEDTGLVDWHDTAALIQDLELVVTIDTAVAHLAGALGVPVWIMLAVDCDWRWQRRRNDSPWYPAARLFRQTAPGDWRPVVAAVAAALRERDDLRSITAAA